MGEKETRFFYGYTVVFGGWLSLFVTGGAQFTFGVFQPALIEEFGWSRALISLAMTLSLITMPLFGMVAGHLVDRIGPRKTVVTGAVVGSMGMFLLAAISELWHFIILYGALLPLGTSLAFMIPIISTVRRWFMRRAALMISIVMTGSSIGVIVLTNVSHQSIEVWGFRGGYITLAVVLVSGGVIGGMVLKKDPESIGTYPDGIKPSEEEMAQRTDFLARGEKWSVSDAFRSRSWWLLISAQFGYLIAVFGLITHMITWGAKDLGIPLGTMVLIFSYVFILSSIIGRVLGGYLSDWHMARFTSNRKPVLYFAILGVGLGVFLCPAVQGVLGVSAVACLLGFSYGTGMAVFPTYLGDLFGLVNMPVLFGVQGLFTAGFSSIGPICYGLIYDRAGSYNPAFILTGVLSILSAVCLVMLKPPKKNQIQKDFLFKSET
jgi:MFS family permease